MRHEYAQKEHSSKGRLSGRSSARRGLLFLGCATVLTVLLAGCASDGAGTVRTFSKNLTDCQKDNFNIRYALCSGVLDVPGTDPNDVIGDDVPGTDPNKVFNTDDAPKTDPNKCGSSWKNNKLVSTDCQCKIETAKLRLTILGCYAKFNGDPGKYKLCLDAVKSSPEAHCSN